MNPVSDEEELELRLANRGLRRGEYSRTFDKSGLVVSQNHAINEYQSMVAENPSARRTCILQSVGNSFVSRPLEGLTEKTLKDVERDLLAMKIQPEDHQVVTTVTCLERALYGKLCAPPLKTAGLITTVLEDKNGKAVLVRIQNAISLAASDAEVVARFPVGQPVVIKEPSFRSTRCGILELRVTNPASFVLLCEHGKPVVKLVGKLPQSGEESDLAIDTLLPQRLDGLDSILCDVCCPDPASTDSYLFYLTRAKLRLRQEKWVKAYKDLDAIEAKVPENMRPAHQLLKKQALDGLLMQFDGDAQARVDSLLPVQPASISVSRGPARKPSGSIPETMISKASNVMERQDIAGVYKLDAYLKVGVEARPTELKCSEYTHSISIQYSAYARTSRGVFAEDTTEPGTLFVASTAIIMVKESPAYGKLSIFMDPYSVSGFAEALSPFQEEIITKLVILMQECPKVAQQVLSLQDYWPHRSTTAAMAVAHSIGETSRQPYRSTPTLCTLAEDSGESELYSGKDVAIDINQLRRIVAINSLRKPRPGGGESGGIWTIPSFFNHSCTPNCSWHIVGDTMFVSAKTSIGLGDELRLAYFNVASTWFFRKYNAERMMFSCCCDRCSFEEELLKHVPDLYCLCKSYNERFEPLGTADSDVIADALPVKLEEAHDFVCKLETILEQDPCRKLTEVEKRWLRSGFAESYKALYAACSPAYQRVANMSIFNWVNMVLDRSLCENPVDILILVFKAISLLSSKGRSDRRLENLVRKVCKRIYVPLGLKDLKTIEKWVLS